MKTVLVSVINDLVTDRRVDNTCRTLVSCGFRVKLIGRKKKSSLPVGKRSYDTKRMKMIFEKGPAFYIFFNLRLFFVLLCHKTDLLFSNDLDTLLPNYIVAKIKGIPLIYDSHEYFTGVPELINRPGVQKVWKTIEKRIFPKLKDVITVNESIARLYFSEYGIMPGVVRNVPPRRGEIIIKTRAALGLPENKHIIILQGAGINVQRGAEEALEAMQYLEQSLLLVVGDGDVIPQLRSRASDPALAGKVLFMGKIAIDELIHYTANADIGLTLDKDTNINYRFSLPNKLFDYIRAEVPVLASDLPEVSRIVNEYGTGLILPCHDPETIAATIQRMIGDPEMMKIWKNNCKLASQTLNWENEESRLTDVLMKYA